MKRALSSRWGVAAQTAWRQRTARERRLLLLGALVLGLTLLWQMAMAPALATWRIAPQRQAELDAQTRQMLQLQAEARQLKAPARIARPTAIASVESSARTLLGADSQVQTQGELLLVKFSAASAAGLAQWLTQSREQAQALPVAARLERLERLERLPPATSANKDQTTGVLWRGELTLRLH